jgi:hypothetical protein
MFRLPSGIAFLNKRKIAAAIAWRRNRSFTLLLKSTISSLDRAAAYPMKEIFGSLAVFATASKPIKRLVLIQRTGP